MDLDLGDRNGWSVLDLGLYLLGIVGLAAALTIVWLSMRAVLDIGGYCAEGGPYEIAHHCPDGVAFLLPVSIFAGLGSAGLMGWKGSQLGGPYANLVLLAWPALFISLGWNFLQFAFFPPPPSTSIELGWLIPGILFVIMGAVPLIGFLPGGKNWKSSDTPAEPTAKYDFMAEGEARYQDGMKSERSKLATDLVQESQQRAASQPATASPPATPDSPASPATENADVVSKLERLSALYRAGSLTHEEFEAAKAATIAEARA